ncbi:hypothetical protein XENTR_v10021063 [Xenopus tropicalis]|nr:hypothetical protein XENTR_v10021063 [Xenopus tropicalis]
MVKLICAATSPKIKSVQYRHLNCTIFNFFSASECLYNPKCLYVWLSSQTKAHCNEIICCFYDLMILA